MTWNDLYDSYLDEPDSWEDGAEDARIEHVESAVEAYLEDDEEYQELLDELELVKVAGGDVKAAESKIQRYRESIEDVAVSDAADEELFKRDPCRYYGIPRNGT